MSQEAEPCSQCAAGVCSAHQPEPTPAELAAAYPWALRVVRYDEHGRLPGHVDDEPDWFPPRSAWGEGPWMTEADLIEWRSKASAPYPLLIHRGGIGQLNGYVGVPPSHPMHGKRNFPGVNWAGACKGKRIPTGEPPDCWWLGFDCARGLEYAPAMYAGLGLIGQITGIEPPPRRPGLHYVTVDECRTRVEALAVVLKAVDTPEVLAQAFEGRGLPLP